MNLKPEPTKDNPKKSPLKEGAKKGERIAKRIATAGLCSRRDAENWIAEGRVQVNGKTLTTPAVLVTAEDEIVVDGLELEHKSNPTRLWRYYKPTGVLCTAKDPQGRPTVFSKLPPSLPRVVTVGRLDINSEGLLLLTTNGELAQTLMRGDFPRTYKVRVQGEIFKHQIERLKKGLTVEGVRYKPMLVDYTKREGANQWLTLTLTEGKNREIRKVCTAMGWRVNRLIRVAYGPWELADLPDNAVQEVPQNKLLKQLKEIKNA